MKFAEVVHTHPERGLTFTGCCDRTVGELPAFDRLSADPALVTCNRLTALDEMLLGGLAQAAGSPRQDAPRRPAESRRPDAPRPGNGKTEQLIYQVVTTVHALCAGRISLSQAHEKVLAAIVEVVPPAAAPQDWSAALMVRLTERAIALADC